MKIRLLVLHRKEAYPGQLAPEILSVVDELTLEDNPEWWEQEVAKQQADVGDDAAAWAQVEATLDVDALMAALYPTPSLGNLSVTAVPLEP